jgi:hypothetical protein
LNSRYSTQQIRDALDTMREMVGALGDVVLPLYRRLEEALQDANRRRCSSRGSNGERAPTLNLVALTGE